MTNKYFLGLQVLFCSYLNAFGFAQRCEDPIPRDEPAAERAVIDQPHPAGGRFGFQDGLGRAGFHSDFQSFLRSVPEGSRHIPAVLAEHHIPSLFAWQAWRAQPAQFLRADGDGFTFRHQAHHRFTRLGCAVVAAGDIG